MKLRVVSSFFMLLSIYGTALGGDKDLEKLLKGEFQDRVLLLRQVPEDHELKFDSQWNVESKVRSAPWYGAEVIVKKVEIKKSTIKITTELQAYVDASVQPQRDVEIVVKGPFSQDNEQIRDSIRSRIFVTKPDEISSIVPKQWQSIFGLKKDSKGFGGIAGTLQNGGFIYRMAPNLTPPKPVSTPDPHYSEEARRKSYQATSVLAVVISAEGRVIGLQLSKPAGMGLDENAASAVREWTFQPATLNGAPVAVIANIEVAFRLY